MRRALALGFVAIACARQAWVAQSPDELARITIDSLVKEYEAPDPLTRFPDPPYRALRATSYNRASIAKDKPGWFADSDGIGFIREETNSGRHEWVIQEQQGPGCLTKFWTPYFYYDLNDHVGPNVRVYLDGASEPLIDLPFIEFVTQNAWPAKYSMPPPRKGNIDIPRWYGGFTARAGNFYVPLPFAKGCKVTLDKPPFYFAIDSRSYPGGTPVESVTREKLLAVIAREKSYGYREGANPTAGVSKLEPGKDASIHLAGGGALWGTNVRLDPAEITLHPELLRQLVLRVRFDGEECIWCPLGDFFGDANTLHSFGTRFRMSTTEGELQSDWRMPFRDTADLELLNLGSVPAHATLSTCNVGLSAPWDARSMHFHASWRPDDVVAGDHFEDWNFVDIQGEGVFVGDQWTVLNLTDGWWGEGDEKIYVDDSVARGFPSLYGTGTEDYYGWAGGVNPTRADVFSQPLLANISVGSTEHDSTRGFNILARDRALDAIPFKQRLVFDMEASPGTDQRNSWNLIGYSSVVFWYGKPGAQSNRGADPEAAKKPLMSLEALDARSRELEQLARSPR